jgi:tripartite-type tricarboxylate transporter receptor subunit TctC
MRRSIGWGFLIAALTYTSSVMAQDVWPNRVIKLIVPFSAGGNTDTVGRVTARFMGMALNGANVIVENRPGAGGITGTHATVTAAPDGYTLCVCGIGPMIGPISIGGSAEKLPYDPLKDLVPISFINTNPLVLAVAPSVKATSVAELVALSKSNADGLTYASPGVGGLMHLAAEIFKSNTGANLVPVPYRTGYLPAVVNSEVHLVFGNMSDALPQISAGKVRALAVTTTNRSPYLPELPTLSEQGLTGYSVESWNGLFAPVGTPKAIVDRLARIMADMAKDESVQKIMSNFGSVALANTPEEFSQRLRVEVAQWKADLTRIGLMAK